MGGFNTDDDARFKVGIFFSFFFFSVVVVVVVPLYYALSFSSKDDKKVEKRKRERERERLLSLAFQYARKACFDDASLFCLDFGAFFWCLLFLFDHENVTRDLFFFDVIP